MVNIHVCESLQVLMAFGWSSLVLGPNLSKNKLKILNLFWGKWNMNSSAHFRFFDNHWTKKQRALSKSVKFSYSQKATNTGKILPLCFDVLKLFKKWWETFSNCLDFSQHLNFIYNNFCKNNIHFCFRIVRYALSLEI